MISTALNISLGMISLSMILIILRVLRGPSLADRVTALDILMTTGIGFIAIYSIYSNNDIFIDVAVILALIAFVGTIAFSYFINRENR
ncbi:MAG: cation:proton antiporter [Caldithrix sp.]|nr:cation:proton antiporter [Caldithrix sp.]